MSLLLQADTEAALIRMGEQILVVNEFQLLFEKHNFKYFLNKNVFLHCPITTFKLLKTLKLWKCNNELCNAFCTDRFL